LPQRGGERREVAAQLALVDDRVHAGVQHVLDGVFQRDEVPALDDNFIDAFAGDADATSDYIAVTLLVASRSRITLKPLNGSEDLREALRVVGSVPSDQLLALEVIWQPEGVGEVLSADELITAYPDLKHL
jgi:uncharacterized membrane protein